MWSLVLALVIGTVVVAVALVLRRRQGAQVPTQPRYQVPAQVDRADFVRPDAPWLVAVFTSSTCHVCADVARKARVLESPEVAVQEVEYTTARALHSRYAIDAVPAVVIVDAEGVVRGSFLGPVTATDLWVSVAEARDPGSTPTSGGCQNHGHGEPHGDEAPDEDQSAVS